MSEGNSDESSSFAERFGDALATDARWRSQVRDRRRNEHISAAADAVFDARDATSFAEGYGDCWLVASRHMTRHEFRVASIVRCGARIGEARAHWMLAGVYLTMAFAEMANE